MGVALAIVLGAFVGALIGTWTGLKFLPVNVAIQIHRTSLNRLFDRMANASIDEVLYEITEDDREFEELEEGAEW